MQESGDAGKLRCGAAVPAQQTEGAGAPDGRQAGAFTKEPAMTVFRCIPMPTETAERFRATGRDDAGNALRHMTAGPSGAPCRHCLRDAAQGEAVLLGSYNLLGPLGIYWTPSPIFVHADRCDRYDQANHVAEIVRPRLVSVRAYDAEAMCLYDLGHVSEGNAVDEALARAMDDERTEFVNIHTAKPGCLLCRVERA
jgi:hypothetical protein